MLVNEVVDGPLLTPADCRKRLREELRDRNCVAAVSDVKPLRHNKYYLVQGLCRGTQQSACPVRWLGTYYRQSCGVPARTWTVRQEGEHVHPSGERPNSGRVLTPQVEDAALRFLRENPQLKKKDLVIGLLQQGHAADSLPSESQLQTWLMNAKARLKRKDREEAAALPQAGLTREVEARKLDEWVHREPATLWDVVVLRTPPPVLERRLCILFGSTGMFEKLKLFSSADVALSVDVKQKCMDDGCGVATLNLLVKDRLRNTSLGRAKEKRVQGRAYTTHALPLLQGIFNTEQEENFSQLFAGAEQLWQQMRPAMPPLRDCVRQLHKDYAPGIEAARRRSFPCSRPVNDFYHVVEKHKKLEAKLVKTHMAKGVFIKTHLSWCKAGLELLRYLPTLDLYSALWGGFLTHLRHIHDEPVAADYLGPEPPATYTVRDTVANLRKAYNIVVNEDDEQQLLSFSPHWSGLCGLIPGTATGNEPSEAFHSPWQKQLEVLSTTAKGVDVLHVMQTLYTMKWRTQCEWGNDAPLYTTPPGQDPSHLCGTVLGRVGRSTAMGLWEAAKTRTVHYVDDMTATLQIIAVSQGEARELVLEDAKRGARLLLAHGAALKTLLLDGGLLQTRSKHEEKDATANYICTELGRARVHFEKIAYVIVATGLAAPFPAAHEPLCTCAGYASAGGCEHVEYVKMLHLRLRAATSFPEAIPTQRPRGRKRGTTVVRAQPKRKRPRSTRQSAQA